MKKATNSKVLFELTNREEEKFIADLHDYFDWVFLAN